MRQWLWAVLTALFIIGFPATAHAQRGSVVSFPRLVPSVPATCTTGDVVFHTGAPVGLHQCIATDTWAQLASGAGSGDVTGPAASVDSEIALFNSTTGKVIKRASLTGLVLATSGVASAVTTSAGIFGAVSDETGGTGVLVGSISPTITTPTISGAIVFPDDVRQTFNPGAATPGFSVGSIAGDPSTPANGDCWYDSTANEFTCRINGANVALGAGGGAPTGATYITQTADGTLSAEQALGALATGCLSSTTTTGVAATRTLTGTANEITVANGDCTAAPTFSIPATFSLAGKTSFNLPTAAAPVVDGAGELAHDNNYGAASNGLLTFFNGTAAQMVVSFPATDTPVAGDIPVWSASGYFTLEAAVTVPIADTQTIIKGSADATKLLRFEVDGFTTGTTRVATPPNADFTMARIDAGQTFTGVQSMTSPDITTSLTTPSTTFALLNATATTVNAFGAATTLNLGASATQILNFGGSTTASEFRFLEPSGSGTNYSSFKAVAQAANAAYSLPPDDGTASQFLQTDGAGVLTWATPGGSGTVTATGGALTANAVVLGAGTTDTKVVAGIITDGTSKLTLGVAGTSVGSVDYKNATSGTITLAPVTGALGTVTLSLPARTDTLVTLGGTETLTAKTLTAPVISTISNTGTVTLFTATDTVVGKATTDVLTNKTLDAEGTGNVLTVVGAYAFQTGAVQGTTASLGLSCKTALCPTATDITGTNVPRAWASFPDSDGEFELVGEIPLRSDFVGVMDVRGKWRTAATSGDIVIQVQWACTADAETLNDTWSTASTTTETAKGTTLQTNDWAITGITITGCAASEHAAVRVMRQRTHASDTLASTFLMGPFNIMLRAAQ